MRSTNGFTFGGYAAAAWNNGTGDHIAAAGSFVFWVENPQGRAPGCLDCVNPATALWCGNYSTYGPFLNGGGSYGSLECSLYLCSGNNPASSYAQPTAGYPDTTGLGDALFTGARQFTLEDYEVWAAAT